MRLLPLPSLVLLTALMLGACERKTVVIEVAPATPIPAPIAETKTLETSRLGGAVKAYEQRPTEENRADVKKALADLDGEIAELEALVAKRTGRSRDEATAKLRNLQSYRAGEVARFTAAQAGATLGARPAGDGRTGAEKIQDGAKRVGKTIEDAAKRTGDVIEDAVR